MHREVGVLAIRNSSRWSTVFTDTLVALPRARRALTVRLVPGILQQQCDNAMSRDGGNRPVAHRDPHVSVCPQVLYMNSHPLASLTPWEWTERGDVREQNTGGQRGATATRSS